jgi:hypothetical protein
MTGGSEPKPVMWGLSIVSWDWVAVAFGIIAVIALFLSATSANRRIAEANERASEANARAENARLEQERLKQIVKWRTIDPSDLSALIAELAKGSGEIDLGYIPGDPESQYFALKIIGDTFIAANKSRGALKWHVYLHRWNSDAMFFGIAIPGPENEQVTILRRAFSAGHIEFSTENLPDEMSPVAIGTGLSWTPAPKHDAFILVGLKNPPL